MAKAKNQQTTHPRTAGGKKPKSHKPHPDLDNHLLQVAGQIVELQAEIQREWEGCFAQPFPGWSHKALIVVAGFAGLPLSDVTDESPFIIYRKAIAKKRPVIWEGPYSPAEWVKRFAISLTTFSRWRKVGALRVEKINSKNILIHADDVRRYEKK